MIIAGATVQSMGNILFSSVIILRVSIGPLPCMFVSGFVFLWQILIVMALGTFDCQALVQLSLTHKWTWIHEWKERSIRAFCALVIFLFLAGTVGTELYRVTLITFGSFYISKAYTIGSQ